MIRDGNALADMTNDVADLSISEVQRAAARQVVCSHAHDAKDAEELMMMLGIHPRQKDDLEYQITGRTLDIASTL